MSTRNLIPKSIDLEKIKEWYNITTEEQWEMIELGDSIEDKYNQLRGRLNDLANIIKEVDEK